MNDQFVTEGIRNDRCLKAARLLDRFESELKAEIERVGDQIVKQNDELFADDVGSKVKVRFNASTISQSKLQEKSGMLWRYCRHTSPSSEISGVSIPRMSTTVESSVGLSDGFP